MSPRTLSSDNRADETAALLRTAMTAGPAERAALHDEVIRRNVGVAQSIARRFARRGEALDDLVQVACVGLTKAVRRFDPDRGYDFLSYAVPTMSGEIKRHFRDAGWAVRPPRRLQELQGSISGAVEDLTQQLGRSPRPSEIAAALEVDPHEVSEALASDGCFAPSSLDERGPSDDGYALADHLGEADSGYDRAEAIAMLRPVCKHLKPRDRHILYLRFFRGWTQAEIAGELGVTQMQVSRLLQRILTSLRQDIDRETVAPSRRPRSEPAGDKAEPVATRERMRGGQRCRSIGVR